MKTLDEVIERLEDDLHATEADSQLIMLFDRDVVDALHYLKEYRETVTNCHQLRKGTWIPVDSGTVNGKCSVCGYESHLYENDVYGEHYCPNCGAWLRMI